MYNCPWLVNQSNDHVLGMYLFGIALEAKLPAQRFFPVNSLIRGGLEYDWLRSNGVSAQRQDGREGILKSRFRPIKDFFRSGMRSTIKD